MICCTKHRMVTGSLQTNRGHYYMVFNYGYDRGKRNRWSQATGLKVQGNRRKAEQMLAKKLREVNEDEAIKNNDRYFHEVVKEWLEFHSTQVSSNTLQKYKYASKHIVGHFKPLKITIGHLKPADVSQYYINKHNNGLTASTLADHKTVIVGALTFAKEYLLLYKGEHPASKVKAPRKVKYNPQYFTEQQINDVFGKVKGKVLETPVVLSAYYGLRRSEVTGLKWTSIDFENRVMVIERTRIDNQNRNKTKTVSSSRNLYLTGEIISYLKQVHKTQQSMKDKSEDNHIDNDYVCIGENGKVIRPDFISRKWKQFLESNELPHIRFHDLRHSSASILLKSGLSLIEIQHWLGHAKIESTSIYAHLANNSSIIAAKKMSEMLQLPMV